MEMLMGEVEETRGMEMLMGEETKEEEGKMDVTWEADRGMLGRRRRDGGVSCRTRGRVRSVQVVPDGEVEAGSEG